MTSGSDPKEAMTTSKASFDSHRWELRGQSELAHNQDPAVDPANQHQREHVHHDAFAERGRTEDVVSKEGTARRSSEAIPEKSPARVQQYAEKEKEEKVRVEYDSENASSGDTDLQTGEVKVSKARRFVQRYRGFVHLFIGLFVTGWWIASLVLHRNDKNWIIPFLVWLCVTLRLIFFHVPITIVTRPMHFVWNNTWVRVAELVPERMRIPSAALLVLVVIVVGAMASPESADNTRANRAVSLFGLAVFIFVLWATSRNRKMIKVRKSSPVSATKLHQLKALVAHGHRWHAHTVHHRPVRSSDKSRLRHL